MTQAPRKFGWMVRHEADPQPSDPANAATASGMGWHRRVKVEWRRRWLDSVEEVSSQQDFSRSLKVISERWTVSPKFK